MANKWVYMFSEGDMTMRNLNNILLQRRVCHCSMKKGLGTK